MALNLMFLLSSIVTARLLDKKKMQVASVAYSVMFIIMMFVLLFTVDVDVIRHMMVSLFGKEGYYGVRYAFLDAIQTPGYGVYIVGALLLTFVVQLALTIFYPVKAIVCCFFKKNSLFQTHKNACYRLVHAVRDLFLYPDVNLLYCRMLN